MNFYGFHNEPSICAFWEGGSFFYTEKIWHANGLVVNLSYESIHSILIDNKDITNAI